MSSTQTLKYTPAEIQTIRLSGILWLASIAGVIIALILIIPNNLILNPDDISTTFITINKHPGLHILELVFDEFSNIMTLLLAGSLFLAFHKLNRPIVLMASMLIGCGSIVMVIHDMGNFALTWIAGAYETSGVVERLMLEKIGFTIILTAKWGVTIGANCIVSGVLMYNLLWISKQGIPKVLGYSGVFCTGLAIFASIPYWLDFSLESLGYNLYFPFLIWQIAMGLWFLCARH